MRWFVPGLIAVAAFAFAPLTAAQAWPDKPVTLVVNFDVGGAPDVVARMYGAHLTEALGQPVVVENRAGAGGNLGIEAVARAAPDGHTLLVSASSPFVIGPHIYKLNFDPAKDIQPVASMALTPMYLVVRPTLDVKSVGDLIAHARANPGKLNYGSAGHGTLPHVTAEMLLHTAKIQALHVPYKGSGAALTGLLREEVDFVFDPGVAIPQVKAGKARLLAVGSASRLQGLPEAPTLAEAGAGMTAVSVVGIYAPAGTPRDVVARLNREITRIMDLPKVRASLAAMSAEPIASSPQEFEALLAKDRDRFGAVVRGANIKVP
ncbi:MAG TPA: tripartite tricarboxylate transporter substrate binding protein [Burkholderiales bacterium]|nr:tripartite tricarboxylate transporter substrate binding protein [Burkholderiales bacterium]